MNHNKKKLKNKKEPTSRTLKTYDWGCLSGSQRRRSSKRSHVIKKAPHHKESWKCSIKRLLDIQAYISIQHPCENYPLSDCTLPIGRPAPYWSITLHVTYATCNRNFQTITPLNRMWQAGGGCQPLSIQTTIPTLTTPSVSSATLSLKITFTSLPSALPSHMFDPVSWAASLLKLHHTFLIWILTQYDSC